jgi:arginine deiminase
VENFLFVYYCPHYTKASSFHADLAQRLQEHGIGVHQVRTKVALGTLPA